MLDSVRSQAGVGLGPSLEGRTIAGKYRVKSVLGAGGFGTVCRVEHLKLGKIYALKILHREYMSDRKMVRRFEREARAVCRIGHQNIVEVFDFGEDPDLGSFFVMENLEGEPLNDCLAREKVLDFERTINILLQLISAVEAAHNTGVVHRDLKPENVFLVPNADGTDFVKLLDFGLVTALEDESSEWITKTVGIMGTPKYMSPEHASGEEIDHRSDIYSLGVIMFRMFTGKVPFTGPTALSILAKHRTDPPPSPSDLASGNDVTPDIENLILHCLDKDPRDRVGTATDVFNRLKEAAENADCKTTVYLHPVKAALLRHGLRPWHRVKRRWMIPILALLSALAVLAVVVTFMPGDPGSSGPDGGGADTTAVQPVAPTVQHPAEPVASVPQPEILERAPPDQPAVAPKCKLIVESRPSEAAVFLPGENQSRGATPLVLRLDCGALPHTVTLKKKGYRDRKAEVPIVILADKKMVNMEVDMKRKTTRPKVKRKKKPGVGADPVFR